MDDCRARVCGHHRQQRGVAGDRGRQPVDDCARRLRLGLLRCCGRPVPRLRHQRRLRGRPEPLPAYVTAARRLGEETPPLTLVAVWWGPFNYSDPVPGDHGGRRQRDVARQQRECNQRAGHVLAWLHRHADAPVLRHDHVAGRLGPGHHWLHRYGGGATIDRCSASGHEAMRREKSETMRSEKSEAMRREKERKQGTLGRVSVSNPPPFHMSACAAPSCRVQRDR